jgi:hypothetical protein
MDAIDLGHPGRGQEPGDRQQVRVGVWDGQARDEVRRHVEAEEEDRVRERAGRDDVLAGDVDAREAEPRQDADGDEVRELAVSQAQRTNR